MRDRLCPIVYHEHGGGDYFRLGLKTDYEGFVPGQFVMLQVPSGGGILLRRPFSLARQQGEVTEILYKVVGKGTLALSGVLPGQAVWVLGPLGHGFKVTSSDQKVVAVAGGYGVAPFLEMAAQLRAQGREFILYYGARSRHDLQYLGDFEKLGAKFFCSTDDGSFGHHGRITELLERDYPQGQLRQVLACGPMGLLKALKCWGDARGISCQLSVEETMGCGTGVCLGCVVPAVEGGFLRACVEGPVFSASEVRW